MGDGRLCPVCYEPGPYPGGCRERLGEDRWGFALGGYVQEDPQQSQGLRAPQLLHRLSPRRGYAEPLLVGPLLSLFFSPPLAPSFSPNPLPLSLSLFASSWDTSPGTPEDYDTAVFTNNKFKEYGLSSEIQATSTLLTSPVERSLQIVAPANKAYV